MFLYGMKLYVFKHLILCSNFSTFKYNDSVDTNIYLQAHGAKDYRREDWDQPDENGLLLRKPKREDTGTYDNTAGA